jgi:hypothetical protein
VTIELINTGSELLLGRVLNTHQQWLCSRFADLGRTVTRQVAVPDGDGGAGRGEAGGGGADAVDDQARRAADGQGEGGGAEPVRDGDGDLAGGDSDGGEGGGGQPEREVALLQQSGDGRGVVDRPAQQVTR